MTGAETLRAAAKLMRERAEAASPSEWHALAPHGWGGGSAEFDVVRGGAWNVMHNDSRSQNGGQFNVAGPVAWKDAEHIASWHPAVALAVADWLDNIAIRHAPSAETVGLYLHLEDDEECATCEGGGHDSTVCVGCYPTWDGMDGHSVYPCAETRAAFTVATTYLGDQP